MPWIKVLFTFAVVAAIGCGGYAFHLHLTEAPKSEVFLAAMLTLFFGITAALLGGLQSRPVHKRRHHRRPHHK